MSWSEVKKINSDLKKPIDEYFRNYYALDGMQRVAISQATYSDPTTVVSLHGKGIILGLYIDVSGVDAYTPYPSILLNTDGSSVIDMKSTGSSYASNVVLVHSLFLLQTPTEPYPTYTKDVIPYNNRGTRVEFQYNTVGAIEFSQYCYLRVSGKVAQNAALLYKLL